MELEITSLYAVAATILFLVLTYRTIKMRAAKKISILHNGDMDLALRMRQHGNFIENVPLALILMAIAEVQGAGSIWLHTMGVLLIIARILHPIGLKIENPAHPLRILGGLGTHAAMLIAVYLIVQKNLF